MCKGYAIVINDKKLIGKGNSHSDIFRENNLKEDDFLKVNIIYDDSKEEGYRIEIDKHNEDKDSTQLKHYQQLGMVTKEGDIISSYLKRISIYCKDKEAEIFRVCCRNMQSATIKGDQTNHSATIKGNQTNHSATIEGDIIIYNTVIKDKDSETSKLIKEFSETCGNWRDATLTNFIKWLKG